MIQLTSTSDLLQVVTSAAADIEAHASWVENNAGTITPGRTNTASITTATTTTVVGSPASSVQRRVKHLNLRNNHASTSCDVTAQHTDGTNVETLAKATLLPGETLVLDEKGEWHHQDANGGEYPRTAFATREEMEGATNVSEIVSPGIQHFHQGHPKVWVKAGVAGNMLLSYNMASVTDTGTGRIAFTIANDFAHVGYAALVNIQRDSTSLAVGEILNPNIRFGTIGVGSFEGECYDFTAATVVLDDPAAWYMAAFGRLD